MTDARDPVRPADAFDWRAGRTWLVFMGSALPFGAAAMVVLAVTRDLVRAGPGLSGWGGTTIEFLLMSAVLLAALLAVHRLAKPHGAEGPRPLLRWYEQEKVDIGPVAAWNIAVAVGASIAAGVVQSTLDLQGIAPEDDIFTVIYAAIFIGPSFYMPLLERFAHRRKPA